MDESELSQLYDAIDCIAQEQQDLADREDALVDTMCVDDLCR